MIVTFEQAVELIQSGNIVAIPTETVYGLAADASNINAIKKIYDIKGRPIQNPLIVHISDYSHLNQLTEELSHDARLLTEKYWPGPLTIVLKKVPAVQDIVTGGLNTVAIRMPDNNLTLKLIDKTGPLTAPSANISGRPSPTRPNHIEHDFGKKIPILDGGVSKIGLESTVVDLSEETITILRPGFVTAEMVEKTTGKTVTKTPHNKFDAAKSPGTRYTHYKPAATVKWLDFNNPVISSDGYYLLHTDNAGTGKNNCFFYNGDYPAFARDLYDHFRTADHLGHSQIFVESFKNCSNHPIIPALVDRIRRAIA